jgi:hypothetical protein
MMMLFLADLKISESEIFSVVSIPLPRGLNMLDAVMLIGPIIIIINNKNYCFE